MSDELTLVEALLPPPGPPKPQPTRGGIIQADSRVFDAMGISLRDCNTQGALEDTGVFADVRQKLLLPENYTIRFIFFRWPEYGVWQIGVTSPDLPPMAENAEPPALIPTYQRLEDGTTRLLKIKIEDRWQRTYSPDELTLERL